VECRFFLDVVISKSSTIIKLFTSKDESLLIWRNSFFVLDFLFDVFNGVRRFNFESDSFSSQGFDEDLHTTSKSENKMKSGFFLDVVISKSSSIIELFSSKDESLLIWRNTFFVLNFGFNVFNGV